MERVFKLSEPFYGESDYVKVSCKYDKKYSGYAAYVEVLERKEYDGVVLWGKCFSGDYYRLGGDAYYVLAKCGRRSKKKEEECIKGIEANAPEYVRKYLDNAGKTHITFNEIEEKIK